MIKLLLLIAVCACNQVLALDQTELRDGAGPDAPFACPAIGTAPVYSRTLHQLPGRRCSDYTISPATNRATAVCHPNGIFGVSYISEGPVDGELTPVITAAQPKTFREARLTPDGQRLYVYGNDMGATLEQYVRGGDGWALVRTMPFPALSGMSTIAATPTGDRILLSRGTEWEEWAEINGTWTYQMLHTRAQLAVGDMRFLNLSLDGRRLLFTGYPLTAYGPQMYYADRESIGAPFSPAVPMQGVPSSNALVFMTEDCGRIYLFGLERLFYVNQ